MIPRLRDRPWWWPWFLVGWVGSMILGGRLVLVGMLSGTIGTLPQDSPCHPAIMMALADYAGQDVQARDTTHLMEPVIDDHANTAVILTDPMIHRQCTVRLDHDRQLRIERIVGGTWDDVLAGYRAVHAIQTINDAEATIATPDGFHGWIGMVDAGHYVLLLSSDQSGTALQELGRTICHYMRTHDG